MAERSKRIMMYDENKVKQINPEEYNLEIYSVSNVKQAIHLI